MGSGRNRKERLATNSRTKRRAGTKTTVIPGGRSPGQGKQGAMPKFRLGRYGRPGKQVLKKAGRRVSQ